MTADVELLEILRDIAAGRRNSAGDYWSRDYCDKAAAKIEALQMEIEALRAEVRDAYAAADSKAGWEWKKRAEAAEASAERLAEALRLYMSAGFGNSTDFYKQAEAKRAATEVLHPTAAQDGK